MPNWMLYALALSEEMRLVAWRTSWEREWHRRFESARYGCSAYGDWT